LDEGAAIRKIVNAISKLGYSWAYRILDTHGFGLPQRRRRWIFLAARDHEASSILFGGDRRQIADDVAARPVAHGFYWTEGTRGTGWADDAIPPLKGGSGVGIPSAPAIWNRGSGAIFVPHITDAERLQGFASNWTRLRGEDENRMKRFRWRLLGNAVSVPMAEWIARRILTARYSAPDGDRLHRTEAFPSGAFGYGSMRVAVDAAERPSRHRTTPIIEFLREPGTPLSARATRGFRTRLEASPLRKNVDFVTALRRHEKSMEATRKRASDTV
jgi:DNA (cytosine-5)-methyltransferase 1